MSRSSDLASGLRALIGPAAAVAALTCLAGCAADTGDGPAESTSAPSSVATLLSGPGVRWQVVSVAAPAVHAMTRKLDEHGNVVQTCASNAKTGASSK